MGKDALMIEAIVRKIWASYLDHKLRYARSNQTQNISSMETYKNLAYDKFQLGGRYLAVVFNLNRFVSVYQYYFFHTNNNM